MIVSIAWQSLLVVLIGIMQVSFLSTWPWPVSALNLSLCVAIFITIMFSYRMGVAWAAGLAFFLELYSALPFGFTIAALVGTIMAVHWMFRNFFTNRSLHSLIILTLIGSALHGFILLFLNLLTAAFGISISTLSFDYWALLLWQPLLHVLVVTIIFAAFNFSSNRLKASFVTPLDYAPRQKH